MSNQTDIKAVSYVHMGDKLVSTDELSPDQRRAFATWLKSSYLNSLFRGRASFYSKTKNEKRERRGRQHGLPRRLFCSIPEFGPPYWLIINFARAGLAFFILTGYCSFFSYTNMFSPPQRLHNPRARGP